MAQSSGLFPEPEVGGLANWDVGTPDQSFAQKGPASRLAGPVITTGALPAASGQPPTSFAQLPLQAPDPWCGFPAPAQQPDMLGSSAPQAARPSGHTRQANMQLQREVRPSGQSEAQQAQASNHDAVLKQVEEMLKGGNSPDMQARLMAIVAAQGRSTGLSEQLPQPSAATAARPTCSASYQPASAAYASSLAGSYHSHQSAPPTTNTQQQSVAHTGQLQPLSAHMRQSPSSLQAAEDKLQPSMYDRGADPYAWSAAPSASSSLHHSTQQQQQKQQAPAAPARPAQVSQQLPQQLLPDSFQLPDSMLPQERSRKAAQQPNPPQARRSHYTARQTGAMSLQQQAQALLPQQEEPEPFDSYLQSSSPAFPKALARSGKVEQPPMSQQHLDAWQLPDGLISQRPNLQRASQGSNEDQNGSSNPLTSPFANAAGSQSMTQALLEPTGFDALPFEDATAAFDLPSDPYSRALQPPAPKQAEPVPPVAGRLPAFQASPPSSTIQPASLRPGTTTAAAGQLPDAFEPLPLRPAPPQRAPPPDDRATAVQNFLRGGARPLAAAPAAAAAPRPDIHPVFQGTSQDSSGASCGLAVSGVHSSQFSPVTSQVCTSCD